MRTGGVRGPVPRAVRVLGVAFKCRGGVGVFGAEDAAFRAGKEGVRASRLKDVRELEESWFWEWYGGEFEAVDIFREIVRIFRIVRKLAIN